MGVRGGRLDIGGGSSRSIRQNAFVQSDQLNLQNQQRQNSHSPLNPQHPAQRQQNILVQRPVHQEQNSNPATPTTYVFNNYNSNNNNDSNIANQYPANTPESMYSSPISDLSSEHYDHTQTYNPIYSQQDFGHDGLNHYQHPNQQHAEHRYIQQAHNNIGYPIHQGTPPRPLPTQHSKSQTNVNQQNLYQIPQRPAPLPQFPTSKNSPKNARFGTGHNTQLTTINTSFGNDNNMHLNRYSDSFRAPESPSTPLQNQQQYSSLPSSYATPPRYNTSVQSNTNINIGSNNNTSISNNTPRSFQAFGPTNAVLTNPVNSQPPKSPIDQAQRTSPHKKATSVAGSFFRKGSLGWLLSPTKSGSASPPSGSPASASSYSSPSPSPSVPQQQYFTSPEQERRAKKAVSFVKTAPEVIQYEALTPEMSFASTSSDETNTTNDSNEEYEEEDEEEYAHNDKEGGQGPFANPTNATTPGVAASSKTMGSRYESEANIHKEDSMSHVPIIEPPKLMSPTLMTMNQRHMNNDDNGQPAAGYGFRMNDGNDQHHSIDQYHTQDQHYPESSESAPRPLPRVPKDSLTLQHVHQQNYNQVQGNSTRRVSARQLPSIEQYIKTESGLPAQPARKEVAAAKEKVGIQSEDILRVKIKREPEPEPTPEPAGHTFIKPEPQEETQTYQASPLAAEKRSVVLNSLSSLRESNQANESQKRDQLQDQYQNEDQDEYRHDDRSDRSGSADTIQNKDLTPTHSANNTYTEASDNIVIPAAYDGDDHNVGEQELSFEAGRQEDEEEKEQEESEWPKEEVPGSLRKEHERQVMKAAGEDEEQEPKEETSKTEIKLTPSLHQEQIPMNTYNPELDNLGSVVTSDPSLAKTTFQPENENYNKQEHLPVSQTEAQTAQTTQSMFDKRSSGARNSGLIEHRSVTLGEAGRLEQVEHAGKVKQEPAEEYVKPEPEEENSPQHSPAESNELTEPNEEDSHHQHDKETEEAEDTEHSSASSPTETVGDESEEQGSPALQVHSKPTFAIQPVSQIKQEAAEREYYSQIIQPKPKSLVPPGYLPAQIHQAPSSSLLSSSSTSSLPSTSLFNTHQGRLAAPMDSFKVSTVGYLNSNEATPSAFLTPPNGATPTGSSTPGSKTGRHPSNAGGTPMLPSVFFPMGQPRQEQFNLFNSNTSAREMRERQEFQETENRRRISFNRFQPLDFNQLVDSRALPPNHYPLQPPLMDPLSTWAPSFSPLEYASFLTPPPQQHFQESGMGHTRSASDGIARYQQTEQERRQSHLATQLSSGFIFANKPGFTADNEFNQRNAQFNYQYNNQLNHQPHHQFNNQVDYQLNYQFNHQPSDVRSKFDIPPFMAPSSKSSRTSMEEMPRNAAMHLNKAPEISGIPDVSKVNKENALNEIDVSTSNDGNNISSDSVNDVMIERGLVENSEKSDNNEGSFDETHLRVNSQTNAGDNYDDDEQLNLESTAQPPQNDIDNSNQPLDSFAKQEEFGTVISTTKQPTTVSTSEPTITPTIANTNTNINATNPPITNSITTQIKQEEMTTAAIHTPPEQTIPRFETHADARRFKEQQRQISVSNRKHRSSGLVDETRFTSDEDETREDQDADEGYDHGNDDDDKQEEEGEKRVEAGEKEDDNIGYTHSNTFNDPLSRPRVSLSNNRNDPEILMNRASLHDFLPNNHQLYDDYHPYVGNNPLVHFPAGNSSSTPKTIPATGAGRGIIQLPTTHHTHNPSHYQNSNNTSNHSHNNNYNSDNSSSSTNSPQPVLLSSAVFQEAQDRYRRSRESTPRDPRDYSSPLLQLAPVVPIDTPPHSSLSKVMNADGFGIYEPPTQPSTHAQGQTEEGEDEEVGRDGKKLESEKPANQPTIPAQPALNHIPIKQEPVEEHASVQTQVQPQPQPQSLQTQPQTQKQAPRPLPLPLPAILPSEAANSSDVSNTYFKPELSPVGEFGFKNADAYDYERSCQSEEIGSGGHSDEGMEESDEEGFDSDEYHSQEFEFEESEEEGDHNEYDDNNNVDENHPGLNKRRSSHRYDQDDERYDDTPSTIVARGTKMKTRPSLIPHNVSVSELIELNQTSLALSAIENPDDSVKVKTEDNQYYQFDESFSNEMYNNNDTPSNAQHEQCLTFTKESGSPKPYSQSQDKTTSNSTTGSTSNTPNTPNTTVTPVTAASKAIDFNPTRSVGDGSSAYNTLPNNNAHEPLNLTFSDPINSNSFADTLSTTNFAANSQNNRKTSTASRKISNDFQQKMNPRPLLSFNINDSASDSLFDDLDKEFDRMLHDDEEEDIKNDNMVRTNNKMIFFFILVLLRFLTSIFYLFIFSLKNNLKNQLLFLNLKKDGMDILFAKTRILWSPQPNSVVSHKPILATFIATAAPKSSTAARSMKRLVASESAK